MAIVRSGEVEKSIFVISLDFELMWGVRDKRTVASYGENILGVREAVPAMLKLFNKYQVKATWAAVGFLLFSTKKEMLAYMPEKRPTYKDRSLDPYDESYMNSIGRDEKSDPYHFGLSLARMIAENELMELGSHTFSHYYCLEDGQNKEQFSADLEASMHATRRIATTPVSLIFPRNQTNRNYLQACADAGFLCYRSNEDSWFNRESSGDEQSLLQRGVRLADTYFNFSGDNAFTQAMEGHLVSIPSSRFLRPYSRRLDCFEQLRLMRIKNSMKAAAKGGKGYHLWWHPHNFGKNLKENLENLEGLLRHYADLREKYGMSSMNMKEIAGLAGTP